MLELFYENEADIPAGYDKLYTEQDGKWVLTGVKGMKTTGDIDKLKDTLKKERAKVKTLEAKVREVEEAGGDVDELKEEIVELKQSLEDAGGEDETKIQERVAREVERAERKLQKTIDKLTDENTSLTDRATKSETKLTSRDIVDASRSQFEELGVTAEAMPDALLNARTSLQVNEDGDIVTADGDTLEGWATDLVDSRKATWLPRAQGSGAGGGQGGGGVSPFSKDGWDIAKQGAYVTQHGEAKAIEEAKRFGVTLGQTQPPI